MKQGRLSETGVSSSPVGFTGGTNFADCITVPAQNWRDCPDEGEGPNEDKTHSCVVDSQPDIFQRTTDHKITLKCQDC